jgi:hypothetical protein
MSDYGIFMLNPVETVVFSLWLAFIITGQIVYRRLCKHRHTAPIDLFMAAVIILCLAFGWLTYPDSYQLAAMVYSIAMQVFCIGVRVRIRENPYLGFYMQAAGVSIVTILAVGSFF